ncbi:MAG: signal peptidase I [Treponema sp.]|jgi:signal peptidase I|nr:signal peptidase I [Treponema sp.]
MRTHRRSFIEQKTKRNKLVRIALYGVIAITAYSILTSLVFSTHTLDNNSMKPQLRAKDRFIVSSLAVRSSLTKLGLFEHAVPFNRGDIVLIDRKRTKIPNIIVVVADSIVRFCTLQTVSLLSNHENFYIKRVVALPGDEVTVSGFVCRVKQRGESYAVTELELTDKPYNIDIPQVPALWDESLPFASSQETVIVGEQECYVVSDDRSNTNDSRTWGPIPLSMVTGRVMFRYWPLNRLGVP